MAREAGLADLTVSDVAKVAGVSTALVHYHFDTKQALLAAVADAAATAAMAALESALAHGQGLGTVDRVWESLIAGATSGDGRLAAELAARAARDPAIATAVARRTAGVRAALVARLPALARELGAPIAVPVEEAAAALAALLDGLSISLSTGTPAGEVRTAYDAFWLILIAAGQGARRR